MHQVNQAHDSISKLREELDLSKNNMDSKQRAHQKMIAERDVKIREQKRKMEDMVSNLYHEADSISATCRRPTEIVVHTLFFLFRYAYLRNSRTLQATEFSEMLRQTLEKMKQRIEISNINWENEKGPQMISQILERETTAM